MGRNFVNLNVNPCKMCMPLGGVTALKGIENTMVILHGSQGCSTYIRRHMAAHYNEPVDIASSSLNEHGTVYGGADNLKKGIRNMAAMYNPELIGVLTTCLAETIGEDIKRITSELLEEDAALNSLKIVPSSTAGYSGTQFEGYFSVLRAVVENLSKSEVSNNKFNIIVPPMSPGDVRNIKEILDDFGIDYILFPDISETLDGPYKEDYSRIPEGGTKLEDIAIMSGAKATIEMGMFVEDSISPGAYLKECYGVPLYRVPMPVGYENSDKFFSLISELSSKEIPVKYLKQRGRLIDAMIDAHKYNGEARAVVYGEPEYCYSISNMCIENGIKPVLIALGTEKESFKKKLIEKFEDVDFKPVVLDDTDFETIEKLALELKANLMIGNSDGRRIEHKHGIDLVRVGFPIHDRLGGQRKTITGYTGTMALLDETSNAILSNKERGYRMDMYEKYYKVENKEIDIKTVEVKNEAKNMKILIKEKTENHPCYNKGAHHNARMHIPVAPNCNISCNYCSRKYDCANESRPGVTSEVLSPEQALEKYKEVKAKVPNLTVLGIAGPGDALANFAKVKKSLELIKTEDPNVTFCLSTNGLMLPFYAQSLIDLDVTHVTITINTVDPEIGAKLYKHIDYLGKIYTGKEGAEILLNNQLTGLRYLASKGVVCKVNIVMVKGVNDVHIPDVVKKVKECGAFITNIMQMIPAEGSVFQSMPLVSQKELNEMRKICEVDLQQMYHCKQCRADAIGTLAQDRSIEFRCADSCNSTKKEEKNTAYAEEVKIAVASKTGINVDQHFGHAEEFYIYSYHKGMIRFLEKRNVLKYCNGMEECDEHEDKIQKIITTIKDCNAVIAMRAGDAPKKKLENSGIKLYQMYETINKGVEKAAAMLSA